MKTSALAALALLMAAPAFAQPHAGSGGQLSTGPNEGPQGSSEAGVDANGDRRICRRVENGSSSRMTTRRVCMTAREWRDYQRNSR
jgi:hypothetical protein